MFKKIILFVMLGFAICAFAQTPGNNTVEVVYNGTTATVNVAENVSQYLTVTQSGAHVSIAQSASLADEITYKLSGTSTDGEFYMSGSYKATVELNGLTLTNLTPVYSGAAIHIQNSKRINVKVATGTTNTLVDAATGSQKGCLYVKGHAEFKQKGTLNVVGNVKHGIKAGEYISLKNATINVTSAVGDGISCNQYFLMESGTVNISGTGDDGIQCDLDGDTSTGETTDHEDEDSGNIYFKGGTVNITCTADATKGFKCAGDMFISGGNITVNANGTLVLEAVNNGYDPSYCTGIKTGGNLTVSDGILEITCPNSNAGGHGISTDGDCIFNGGTVTITATGACASYTDSTGIVDAYKSTCVKSDGNIIISGGTLTATAGGRAFAADGDYVQTGGNITSTTSANGFTTIGSGTSCTDGFAPACLKVDGDITVTGGVFKGTSTGKGGRGISCDGNLAVGILGANDDNVYIYVTTSGSPVNGVSTNNSSIDIWKGLPKGIKIDGSITINSGHVQSYCSQTSGDPNGEALESKDSLIINGGYIETNAYDDAINASNYLEINGGYVWAYARGNDAIDCNGTSMYVNGGNVIAMGSECGIDDNSDRGGHLYITGGTLVAVGSNGSGMGPGMGGTEGTPTMTNQKYISLGSSSGGSPWGGGGSSSSVSATNGFTIKNSHSSNILTFKAPTVSGSGFHSVSMSNDAASTGSENSDGNSPKAGPGGQSGVGKILVSSPGINCDSYTYFTSPTISGGSNWHGLYSGSTVSTSGSGTSATAMPTSTITYSTHINVSSCEPYTWHGTTYNTSGVHSVTLTSIVCGVDSVVTLHLTVNSPDATEFSATACESYDWNGETYTESGDYEQTFSNVNGCDSVVTLHLTVNHGTHNAETETAHEFYVWHGETYTESGTYTFEYDNNEGCESIDTLHLTVIHCGISTLPFMENFDRYTNSTANETGTQPDCWDVVTEDVTLTEATKPQVYRGFATSGSYSLRMKNRCLYAMPSLDENVPVNALKMTFNLRQPKAVYRLQVGVVNENGVFKVVKTINNASTGKEPVTVDFTDYSGDGHRIAFRNTLAKGSNLDYSYNYIDDIEISYANACEIAVLPYTENFDSYTTTTATETGVQPDCWEVITQDATLTEATMPQLYRGYATSGSYSMRMKNRCVYAMNPLSENINVGDLTMTFNLRQAKSIYRLQVGVLNENGEFTVVKTLKCSNTSNLEAKTVNFSGYTGNRIAFRNTLVPGTGMSTDYLDYSVNYIDNIHLDYTTVSKQDANAVDALAADLDQVDVMVYPNPTKDVVNVQCTMNNVQCSGIEIVDVYGKIITTVGTRFIASSQFPASAQSPASAPTQINVSGLAAGMYFVRVTTDKGVVTKPFVKR